MKKSMSLTCFLASGRPIPPSLMLFILDSYYPPKLLRNRNSVVGSLEAEHLQYFYYCTAHQWEPLDLEDFISIFFEVVEFVVLCHKTYNLNESRSRMGFRH